MAAKAKHAKKKPRPFQYIDCYQLFNTQQRTFCSLTIDIQPVENYNKSHIRNALNVPITTANIVRTIVEHQQAYSKNYIVFVHIYSNDIEKKENLKHISSIIRAVTKTKICKKDQVFILKENYSVFFGKFPFLCEVGETAESAAENKEDWKEKPKKKSSDGRKTCRFKQENTMVYPSQILPDRLFLGGKTGAISEKVISDFKITHIINCTQAPPEYIDTFTPTGYIKNVFENSKQMNVKYMRVAIDDRRSQNIKTHFSKAIAFINEAFEDENNRVLVHCFSGISRSATIVIAYLMKTHAMSYFDAYLFVKERRETIKPNKGFVKQLKRFETNIQSTN